MIAAQASQLVKGLALTAAHHTLKCTSTSYGELLLTEPSLWPMQSLLSLFCKQESHKLAFLESSLCGGVAQSPG